MGADQDAAIRALKRMKQEEDEAKGYYGTVSTPVPPAVADSIPNTLPAPDPADPSYVDHTQPTMADRTRAILQPSYDGAANLASKVKEKAADLDWRNVAKRGLEIAAGPLGLMHAANEKMNSLANRDGGAGQPPPAQPTEQSAQGGGQAWGTPVQQQPQPEQTGSGEREVDYQLPISDAERMAGRGGGGSGNGDLEMARMAAGNVGIVPELQAARERAKGTIRQGVSDIGGRQAEMVRALSDEQEARRQVAFQEEAKARAIQDATNQRMADEQQLRSMLTEASNISPERYWDSQGGTGAKFAAAAGLLISGLAGPKAVESTAANINKQIDRHVESQVAAFNAKLGLTKEVRAQWDARMQALNDIQAAKLSAKMQAVDAAKSYFLGQMNLAKTDEAKTSLAMLADNLDMKNAELQQQYASHTQQKLYEIVHQREQQAAAAAQRAAAWAREDRHRSEDKQFQERMLDKKLAEQEQVAAMRRGGGLGGAGSTDGLTPGQFATHLEKYGKGRREVDEFSQSVGNVEQQLSSLGEDLPGYGPIAQYLPNWMLSKEGRALRQNLENLTQSEVYRRSGKAVTDAEQKSIKRIISGVGDRTDVMNGLNLLKRVRDIDESTMNQSTLPSVRSFYEGQGAH